MSPPYCRYDVKHYIINQTINMSYLQEDGYQFKLSSSALHPVTDFSLTHVGPNARHIMFDKLFALVGLSFVDTHTLLWGHEQLSHDITADFFPRFIT